MNCPDNENVCSVKKESNVGYYRLHTIWKSDGFFLNVASKDGAWRGEMTSSDLKNISSQLETEPDVYLKQCREALTSHDGQPGMVYSVENGSFTWKKVLDEDSGIKIKMGSVMLEPTGFVDTIQNLVNAALNCNKRLQGQLKVLSEERGKIAANRDELLNKLSKLIESKNLMEEDFYARFVVLLNSKKKKILELETALSVRSEKQSKGKKNEEDPYDVDTDYEDVPGIERKGLIERISSEGESSEEKKIINDEKSSTSLIIEKNISKTPLTADGILEYFWGED